MSQMTLYRPVSCCSELSAAIRQKQSTLRLVTVTTRFDLGESSLRALHSVDSSQSKNGHLCLICIFVAIFTKLWIQIYCFQATPVTSTAKGRASQYRINVIRSSKKNWHRRTFNNHSPKAFVDSLYVHPSIDPPVPNTYQRSDN